MSEIRFATKEDIPAIMEFIRLYWAEKHILAHDREIFDFQYVYGEEVCFVLDTNQDSGEIEGVLGYIPYGTGEERDIFTAIWKVKKNAGFLQGTELIKYLEQNGRCKNLYCVGLADRVVSIMKYLRKKIADYEHYFMVNPEVENFKVADIPGPVAGNAQKCLLNAQNIQDISYSKVEDIRDTELLLRKSEGIRYPYKTVDYVKRRYFMHPEYVYDKWKICMEGKEALLVCKEQKTELGCIYRVIDCLGDLECMQACGVVLGKVMAERAYEYADCLVCGMDEAVMEQAGFWKKTEEEGCIIPNYFEPFEKRNVVIHNFMPKGVDTVMFKGDGDQDRPSIRKKENLCNR